MSFSKKRKQRADYTIKAITHGVVHNRFNEVTWEGGEGDSYTLADNRPENVSNPPDATGWRKPSRFQTHPGIWGPMLFGQIEDVKLTYAASVPAWTRTATIDRCIIGYHGVQFNFRSSPGSLPSMWNLPLSTIWGKITWEMEQAIRVQAIASLASRKGKVLETFAEMRSSVAGLARNAEDISWFIDNHRDAKKLRKKFNLSPKHPALKRMRVLAQNTKGAAEFFGKQWLNFWFGLAPIVDEMVFVTAILSNPENFKRLRVKGNGHRWVDEVITTSRNFPGHAQTFPVSDLKVNLRIPLRVGIRLSAYYQVESETLAGLKQYGMLDVASTAWAIAPLSWMVDWVIPVTKLLESYEGLAGLSYKGATVTKYYVVGEPELDAAFVAQNFLHESKAIRKDQLKALLVGGKGFTRDIVLPMGMLPAPYIKDPLGLWTATTALSFLSVKLSKVLNIDSGFHRITRRTYG